MATTIGELEAHVSIDDRDLDRGLTNVERKLRRAGDAGERDLGRMSAGADQASKAMNLMDVSTGGTVASLAAMDGAMGAIKWPVMFTGAGLAAQALGSLAAGGVAVASALAPAAGVVASLPALFGAAKIAQATMTLGLGDVKKALSATDEEWLKMAADMNPAQREMGQLLRDNLIPLREELKTIASSSMLPGIAAGFKAAFTPQLVDVTKDAVRGMATELGGLAKQAGQMLGSNEWARDLRTLTADAAVNVGKLGGAGLDLAAALKDIMVAAQPLTDWLVGTIVHFANWVKNAADAGRESGRLAGFFDKTRDTVSLLLDIFKNLGSAFLDVGKAAYPLGHDILVALNEQTGKLADWASSEGGQESLRKYFDAAKPVIWEVGRLLRDITGAMIKISDPAAARDSGLLGMLTRIRTEVLPLFQGTIQNSLQQMGPALSDLIVNVLKLVAALSGSNGPLTTFLEVISKIAGSLADLLTNNPGLQSFVFTLGGMVGVFKALNLVTAITGVEKFAGALVTARAATVAQTAAVEGQTVATEGATVAQTGLNAAMRANLIGIIITALQILIAAVVVAYQRSETFRDIVNGAFTVMSQVVSTVIDTVTTIIGGYAAFIEGAWDTIRSVTRTTWDTFKDIIHGVVSTVEFYFKNFTVPGLIISHWDTIKSVTKTAWETVKNYIVDPIKDAVGIVRDTVGDIVDFFRDLPGRAGKAILNAAGELKDAVVSIFKDKLLGWVKDALGIGSPSREFEQIGKYTVQGMIKGIAGMAGALSAKVKGMVGDIVDEAGGMAGALAGRLGRAAQEAASAVADIAKGAIGPGGPVSHDIVSIGRWLQGLGFQVSENPAFGGVHPVHAPGSYHYQGRAIDVNWPGGGPVEYQHLLPIYNALRREGMAELLLEDVGTANQHLHIALGKGGIVTQPTRALLGEAGPEAVIPLSQAGGLGTTVIVQVEGNVWQTQALAEALADVFNREGSRGRSLLVSP